jgi:serine/threonine protein kinase
MSAFVEAQGDPRTEYDHLIGQTLDGRYRIERKIGEGGMGVVFAARHTVIERPLAIKVLKRAVMRDQATIQRFVQEAKAASRINHPNIVEVTDFGTTPDGLTYSVMELVEGETLTRAIKHGAPFPARRVIRVAMQLARALGAAHDKGIVHRDLKPENVFLVDREERPDFVKIVDFGIAKMMPVEGEAQGSAPRLTRVGTVFGTPDYMAPEQAAGRLDIDHRVDIYALGTILYEMLVGRVPHKADSLVRTIAMQMFDPADPPSQVRPDLAIPKSLELLVMRCLAKERGERFQKMSELGEELERIARELDAPLPPASDAVTTNVAPRRARPATRQLHEPEFVSGGAPRFQVPDDEPPAAQRRRWPLVLGALVVLGAAAGTAYVLTRAPHGAAVAVAADAAAADAARVAELSVDAAPAIPGDASVVAEVPADASEAPTPHHRDAGTVTIARDPKRKIRIEILAEPSTADIYVGTTYRGPSGTTLEEPFGTTLTINCRVPHYQGKKTLVFDGKITAAYCSATTRIPLCVAGMKNPFDVCDPDPNATTDPMNNP